MTEKRFYTDGQYVMQKGEVWVVAGGEHSADVIATALNELIEERNTLQFDYNMEVLTRQSIEKENKQLKSILFDTVGKLEMKINPNEDTLYAVTLAVDGAMYLKIKEIIHE